MSGHCCHDHESYDRHMTCQLDLPHCFLVCEVVLMFLQGMARPSGRSGHSMALTSLPDNKAGLVVFGGASKNDLLHNDTWVLELPSLP